MATISLDINSDIKHKNRYIYPFNFLTFRLRQTYTIHSFDQFLIYLGFSFGID